MCLRYQAIEYAKQLIEDRRSRGDIRLALMERFELSKSEAGGIAREASCELYEHPSTDVIFWIAQTTFDANPQQRRFAKRRIQEITTQRASTF